MSDSVDIISSKRVVEGKLISVDIDVIQEPHAPENSKREVVRASAASAVVPVTDTGNVVLVRQYRYAVGRSLWEIPAGMRDPGETAEECAARELAEESGYRTAKLSPLIKLHTTPGFCDEVIDIFRADGLTPGKPNPDTMERFEIAEFSFEEISRMIAAGEITDAKTISGVLIVSADIEQTQENVLENSPHD